MQAGNVSILLYTRFHDLQRNHGNIAADAPLVGSRCHNGRRLCLAAAAARSAFRGIATGAQRWGRIGYRR